MRKFVLALFPAILGGCVATQQETTVTATETAGDPYIWLEDADGEKPLAWVEAENAKTFAALESDPRYAQSNAEAFAVATAEDRIAYPLFRGGEIFNFWSDAEHLRGLWRKTSLASYRSGQPEWTTLLDIDALGKAEGRSWVYGGVECLKPEERLCMIGLSDGGEDAKEYREFDLAAQAFVEGGLFLPKGRTSLAWEDADHLLVGTDFSGDGSDATRSGYPAVVKRVTRGNPLGEAEELLRIDSSDLGAFAAVLHDNHGHALTMILQVVDFFHTTFHVATPRGIEQLAIPQQAEVTALIADRLIVKLSEDWSIAGETFPSGAVVSVSREAILADPANLSPTLVWKPGPSQSYESLATTKDRLVIAGLDNVRGRIWAFAPEADGGWRQTTLDLPDNLALGLISGDDRSNRIFFTAEGFTTPTTLSLLDLDTGDSEVVRTSPARFDASGLVVEQRWATSRDGTRVPYFLVHREDAEWDGKTPTVLYGYGGFAVSETPNYSGITGKLWLENGGAWALANIRGGGEFGPQWHQAALKTNRQRSYDDFAAIGEDLIASGFTSSEHLGIMGGSNGGLLTGVAMIQRPELWNAAVIQVPLLDMIRIAEIGAGASWQGEYGDVDADPDTMAFWLAHSPYHLLEKGADYPLPLIYTSTRDDRTHPAHGRKFAARMAELDLPYYYFENIEGGHAAGADPKQSARMWALTYIYLMQRLMD